MEAAVVYFKDLSRHLYSGAERNHEKFRIITLWDEFRTRNRSYNHSITVFGSTSSAFVVSVQIRGCIQKFSDWPPGARTTNGRALCH
jgi:hypothetical protein